MVSLRKQPTFRDTTTGVPAKWRLRNECRNSILMTCHYPTLGSASDWLIQISHAARPIRSTTQIAKCRLFSQASQWWAGQLFAEGEKMTVLDSGFQVLDCGFLVSGTWIPDHSRKLSCRFQSPAFPGSTNKSFPDCGLGKQKFPGFWNPDYITCGNGRNKAPECWVCLSYKKLANCYKQSQAKEHSAALYSKN